MKAILLDDTCVGCAICNSYCMTNCALAYLLLESIPEGEYNEDPMHCWSYNNLLVGA